MKVIISLCLFFIANFSFSQQQKSLTKFNENGVVYDGGCIIYRNRDGGWDNYSNSSDYSYWIKGIAVGGSVLSNTLIFTSNDPKDKALISMYKVANELEGYTYPAVIDGKYPMIYYYTKTNDGFDKIFFLIYASTSKHSHVIQVYVIGESQEIINQILSKFHINN